MHYVKLVNNNVLLRTSEGVVTLTPRSFNFRKVLRLLDKGAEEEEVLPLLVTPKLPDGLFEVYVNEEANYLILHNYVEKEGGTQEITTEVFGTTESYRNLPKTKLTDLAGVYASKAAVIEDWPEYML